jgi:hypothetical protein
MGKRDTQSRSGRSTNPSTDKAHSSVTEAFESTDEWSGGQVERGPWFQKRLNEIQTIFKFKLLCLSAAVSIPSKGQVAVFSAEHAKEHLAGKNQGTIKSPNMRTRETIDMTSSTQPQPTQAPTPAHGGYPGTPTPPTPAAPAQTYAATVVSSSGRPVSHLEFSDTLISVDQFWQDSQVDTIFNSTRCLAVPGKGEEPPLDIPFERRENLYKWASIPTSRQNSAHENSRALKATIHRPNSTSFFNVLPPNEALELLSRRLHVGHGSIKKLGTLSQEDTNPPGRVFVCFNKSDALIHIWLDFCPGGFTVCAKNPVGRVCA